MFLSSCLLISFVAQSVGLVVGAAMNVQVNTSILTTYIRNSIRYFDFDFYYDGGMPNASCSIIGIVTTLFAFNAILMTTG